MQNKFSYESWKKDIKKVLLPVFIYFILLILSVVLTLVATNYLSKVSTEPASDLILDNFKPIQSLGMVFLFWPILVILLAFIKGIFYEPKKLHHLILFFVLLYSIRSFFIVLTHLSTPLGAVDVPYTPENDVFFSGHVSLPFLCFLVFKGIKTKTFFLLSSLLMAFVVLATHRHYSIDVAAAFFITYGIYKIGLKLNTFIKKKFNI